MQYGAKKFKTLREAKRYQTEVKKNTYHDYRIYKWNRGNTFKYVVATELQWLNMWNEKSINC